MPFSACVSWWDGGLSLGPFLILLLVLSTPSAVCFASPTLWRPFPSCSRMLAWLLTLHNVACALVSERRMHFECLSLQNVFSSSLSESILKVVY